MFSAKSEKGNYRVYKIFLVENSKEVEFGILSFEDELKIALEREVKNFKFGSDTRVQNAVDIGGERFIETTFVGYMGKELEILYPGSKYVENNNKKSLVLPKSQVILQKYGKKFILRPIDEQLETIKDENEKVTLCNAVNISNLEFSFKIGEPANLKIKLLCMVDCDEKSSTYGQDIVFGDLSGGTISG